jgi:hypothetical protein
MKIEIVIEGKGRALAEIDDRNPNTAEEICKNLPLEGSAKIWQEEVYFEIPVNLVHENKSPTSEKGDISYWPIGNAFCIFYGKSQPYSDVNHIGKIIENLEIFKTIENGDKIILRILDEK